MGAGEELVMVKQKGTDQNHRTRDTQSHQVREPGTGFVQLRIVENPSEWD